MTYEEKIYKDTNRSFKMYKNHWNFLKNPFVVKWFYENKEFSYVSQNGNVVLKFKNFNGYITMLRDSRLVINERDLDRLLKTEFYPENHYGGMIW